ncbi:MAG: type IV pilus secretin PilQ, partial [Candidatus Omnitrophota bacterium]
ALNFPTTSTAASIGFNFVRLAGTPFVLNAKLLAMESQGEGKIISAPKVVTLDNKKATIKQGLRYPYNKLDDSGNTVTVFENIDLVLEVKPHVTPDNRISMTLSIKKSDLGNIIINNQQSFTTKEAETELLVNDGDTVVIGGIIKTTNALGESGVPGLSKIPVLGWLFKSKSNTNNKEELLIFITPRIVQMEQRNAT